MSRFNILRNADIRNSMLCRYDTNEGYSVSWSEDNDFQQYGEFSGITTRSVENQNYFSVATSGICYVGPTSDQAPFDGGVFDLVKVTYRLDIGFNQLVPTTGRLQFQTVSDPTYDDEKVVDFPINPDNAYNEYTVDLSQTRLWQGDISRIRLYPFIDGSPGSQIHLQAIRVQSSTKHACATGYDGGGVCSKFSEYSHPCPWTGSGGTSEAVAISEGIDIIEGVNDELTINVNDYGEQTVTLKPAAGVGLATIARDIEDKLSNIAIGGFAGNRTEVTLSRLLITAEDTREAISTVVVSDTPAARLLGFYNNEGTKVATEAPGVQAATRYAPAGTVQLSKTEIAQFYVPDQAINKSTITLDPHNYAAEAGRRDFTLVTRDRSVDFINKTIIDFNRPVTQTGLFTFFGFSGDATTTTQVVFFRPKADGTLTLIDTVPLGATGSLTDRVFGLTMSVYLRKGDLVGIADGEIYLGDFAEHPNVSYFLYDGELSIGDTIPTPLIYGLGDGGLPLYARGTDKQTEVVLDIQFQQPELVEEIQVIATEEAREEVVNLTQTLSGGINGGPFVTGETGLDKFGAQAPALTDLGAITDGVKTKAPGALALHPSWLDSGFSPADKYDQTEFAIILDFAKGVPVFFEISKVIVHYRDANNVKFFRVDYPITTSPDDSDRHWGPVTNIFDRVALDGKTLSPNNHPLYSHPIQITVENFNDAHQFVEYNSIEFNFPPVAARSLKFGVKNYFFNDDVDSFDLSDYPLTVSPYFLEMEVFAVNTPKANISDNFSFESAGDDGVFYPHTVVRDGGTTSATYLIGYPVRYLRSRIRPQGKLEIKSFDVSLSQSALDIDTNAGDQVVSLQISKEDFVSHEVAVVTNDSQQTYNYYVDISPQRNAVERCLLWNKMGTPAQLSKSQIGPSPSVIKREPFYPRETNMALNVPAYVLDPLWMMNRNTQAYITYDLGTTWEKRGGIVTNYNYTDFINSKTPDYTTLAFVYVLVDLGKVYPLVTVEQKFPGGTSAVKAFADSILYSNLDVDTPEELDINADFSTNKNATRWVRLRAIPHNPASNSQVPTLSFLRTTIDPRNPLLNDDVPWVPAPKMTNYLFGTDTPSDSNCGEGWHCAETAFPDPPHYYAINLEYHYNITNIITGPQSSDTLALTTDIDKLLPGGAGSAYPANGTKINSEFAYGVSQTDDPQHVQWGSFGAAPPEKTKWILVQKHGWLADEIAVHVNDNVNENKPLFPNPRWWTAQLGAVTRDNSESHNGTHSISVTYAKDQGPAVEEIEVIRTLGIDEKLAKRDTLKLFLYVSDANQLDLSQGHIALGRNITENNGGMQPLSGVEPDREQFFQWNFSDMPGLITSGWNTLHLPFTDNFRSGQPRLTTNFSIFPGFANAAPRSRLRWFRVNFVGKENNEEVSVKVGDLSIERGDFVPAKFGNGYYLAGDDYAKFPLNNFNVLQGTIEFYLRADWTKTPGCNSCEDPRDHVLFRLFNSDDFIVSLYMTGMGMRVYASNGNQAFLLTDNDSPRYIFNDVDTHIAVTWDFKGERSDRGLAFFVNGELSSTMSAELTSPETWLPNSVVTLLLGGPAWDGVVGNTTSSVDGVVDNLRVYNYAKSDFTHSIQNQELEHIRASDELVEISLDGVNFYGSEARGTELPLLVQNVVPGQRFNVYVRNKEQEGTTSLEGQERLSYLEIIKARAG